MSSRKVANPWKDTEVRISPSLVYVMSLLRDNVWEFVPSTLVEHRALQRCVDRGWVVRTLKPGERMYRLTTVGDAVALVCRAFVADAAREAQT